MLGEKAATVFDAANQLSFIVNVTQLGLKPKRKFKIRHGVSYEQDALLIKISHEGGVESLDLIRRAVVLAFRLSGIPAKSPSIVTQKELVAASADLLEYGPTFSRWQVSATDKLKFFKGERWGTEGIIYLSISHGKLRASRQSCGKRKRPLIQWRVRVLSWIEARYFQNVSLKT